MAEGNDPRLVAVEDLGRLVEIYKYDGPLVSDGVLGGGCAFVVLMGLASVVLQPPLASFLMVAIGIGLLGAVFVFLLDRELGHKLFGLYEGGLAYHDGRRVTQVRWGEVTRLIDPRSGDAPDDMAPYVIETMQGRSIPIPWSVEGRERLWAAIRTNTLRAGMAGRHVP